MLNLDGSPTESHAMTRFYPCLNGNYFDTLSLKACSLTQ